MVLAAGCRICQNRPQIGVPQSLNAIVDPFGTFFSCSVTGKALGLPMYGATAAAAAALSTLAAVVLPVDAALVLLLLLPSSLLPHAARPMAIAKQAADTGTIFLASRCNVTPPNRASQPTLP